MSELRELEVKFDGEMFNIYKRAKQEAGYNATRFLQMLDEHRGLERKGATKEKKTVQQYEWCSKHILDARTRAQESGAFA